MNRYILMVVMLALSITTFAQNVNNELQSPKVGYICNTPLPYHPSQLNVLFIGNSYSVDTAYGLPEILNNMNIKNVNVYVLYKAACSMKQHYELFKSQEKEYVLYRYNYQGQTVVEKKIALRDAMSRFNYDVVVFQQYSLESGEFETYEPYLSKLVQAYNITKIGARTTFAFNQTWAYASTKKEISRYGSQEQMYKKICEATQKMKAESGIDVIIPTGTAVQNARNMYGLVIEKELTRDSSSHLDLYMGRYLAACTFFEAIIAPTLERNLREDTTNYGKAKASNAVNYSNRELLKKCALLAVANNYSVSEFVNE